MEKEVWKEEEQSAVNYHRTEMRKELILQRLKENGCRITKQRRILLDIILQEDCASCKEIYYKAAMQDHSIGTATVYRMVNLLEEIGAISRKNMYRISDAIEDAEENVCTITFADKSICRLSAGEWNQVVAEGLRCCGYADRQKVERVWLEPSLSDRK